MRTKIFTVGLITSALLLVGCSNTTEQPTPEPTKPTTEYTWEENNSGLTEELQITGIKATIDESKLPSGLTKETVTQEEQVSGNAPEDSGNNVTANYDNAEKTCFLGVNTYGQVLNVEEGTDPTDALVKTQTEYLKEPKISAATIPTDNDTPLEVQVIESNIEGVTMFSALRAFDLQVATGTLTEAGEPAEGNQVLAVTYSCSTEPAITVSDFQNILNAVTVSYTTE